MSNKGVISNINLNNNSSYSIASTATAICSTAANTKVKAASIVNSESGSLTDFTLIDGLTINVFFENTNTADNPILNINESGQRFIYKFNTSNTNITWKAGSVLTLTYFSDQEKEGWWINGEYDVAELYKITVTGSNNSYSSDKNYEDILAAYNSGDKFIYLSSGDDIYPLVSKGQVSFNFENATDTGLSKFVIRLDEPQQQDEDYTTGVYYKFVKFTSTAADTLNSGDKLVINRTTSIGDYSYSENLTSPITFGSSSLQYLANNGTWQNIPKDAYNINYTPYDSHDWPEYDPQDVQVALDDLAARKTGTADVQVNGTSILSSGVANLITNTAYNSSSNTLATMSDINNKFYTINISYSSSSLKYISDKLFADIYDAYSNGEILMVSYSPDESNNHYQLIGVKFDSHDLPTNFIFGLIVDQQTDNYTCLVDYFYITDSDEVYRSTIELSEEDHVHGNMASDGSISDNVEISSGDRLIISDKSNLSRLVCSSITFGTSTNTFLANDGTWRGVSGASGGTVTEVNTGTDLTGGPITGSGTISHATSGVIAKTTRGLYPFKVNSTGHITDVGSAVTVPTKTSDLTNDSGFTSNTGTITGITMNGSSKGTSGVVNLGTVLTEIPTADQIVYQPEDQTWSVSDVDEALNDLKIYSDSSITDIKVNSSSQTISNKSVNITVPTKVSDLTNDSGFTSNTGTVTSITAGTGLTGGTITSSGTIALGTSGVTAGTYQGLTVDKYGRVTSASNQNYLTSESDPTVPAWAKASSKPTYTASEVGALSSTVPVNIGDGLYLRGTGLWRSTTTTNADRIITTVNSGKDLMINADSTKTDANTGTIFLGYTNTTAVNIGTSSSDVALNYNGSAVFSNSYTSPSVYSSRCTVTNGGYMQIGKWVIVNLYITIDTTLNANTNSLLVYNLPEPEFSMSLSASATAPGTVKGLNSFIRKHTTSGVTKGEVCICSTSGLASGNVVLISGIYTVS